MSFLHPALLWLLPLAAIPIVLHLLTLPRLRTVELSTFRFLMDSYVQQRRRLRFLEALLAFLRTMFLLLLVVLVARPAVRAWGQLFQGGSGRETFLLVDLSAGMNAHATGESSLDRARHVARKVVEKTHPDSRVTLVGIGARPHTLISRFAGDGKQLQQALDGLRVVPGRGNIYAALDYVLDPADGPRPESPTIYCFTDCAADGWREVNHQATSLLRRMSRDTRLFVVDVGDSAPSANVAVHGDAPRTTRPIAKLPVLLQPRIANLSHTEPADVVLSVVFDEKEVARQSIALRPRQTLASRFVIRPETPGVIRGRFEILRQPTDSFPDDDRFMFVLQVEPKIKVLLVNGHPSPDPFADEALYLRTALSATFATISTSKAKEAATGSSATDAPTTMEVVEIPEGRLDPGALKDSSVVVLANCGQLAPNQFGWLRDFVFHGGGLIVLPGERVNPDQYNDNLLAIPGPTKDRVIAIAWNAAEGDPERIETADRLASLDFSHPMLNVFDEADARFFRSAIVYRRLPLVLLQDGGGSWPLARHTDGRAAIAESRYGAGVVLLASFPAHPRWTNLPLKPEFVPFMLRMVEHAQRRLDVDVPAVVAAGDAAEIGVAAAWAPMTVKITDPAGRIESAAVTRAGAQWVSAYAATNRIGYYGVEIGGGSPENPRFARRGFAVNVSPDESDFSRMNEHTLKQMLGDTLTYVDATAQAQQLLGSIGDEREIWRPLIYLMLAVIGIEFLLATLGSTASRERRVWFSRLVEWLSPRHLQLEK